MGSGTKNGSQILVPEQKMALKYGYRNKKWLSNMGTGTKHGFQILVPEQRVDINFCCCSATSLQLLMMATIVLMYSVDIISNVLPWTALHLDSKLILLILEFQLKWKSVDSQLARLVIISQPATHIGWVGGRLTRTKNVWVTKFDAHFLFRYPYLRAIFCSGTEIWEPIFVPVPIFESHFLFRYPCFESHFLFRYPVFRGRVTSKKSKK